MNIFGGVEQKDFDAFKTEVQKRLSSLDQQIASKVTDSEELAKQAAERAGKSALDAKEMASQVSAIYSGLDGLNSSIGEQLAKISADEVSLRQKIDSISGELDAFRTDFEKISGLKESSSSLHAAIKASSDEVSAQAEAVRKLSSEIVDANNKIAEVKKMRSDMDALLNHVMQKRVEVDQIYEEIYGRDIKSSEGEVQRVEGIKEKLEKSYLSVSNEIGNLEGKLDSITDSVIEKYDEKLVEASGRFEAVIGDGKSKVSSVSAELDNLLPGAMAAGLSAAYEEKANNEIKEQVILEKRFRNAIGALVAVSIIPFLVDYHLLIDQKKGIVEIIQGTPNLILAILPLYFPILWFAYSTGKKLNLAKRLIEEYTHKSALGKTFAGLSKQIEALSDGNEVKQELRISLLFNFLQVSSENPGKLIKNYDKSDHPLMEALENSSKLTSSVEALAKIPGLGALAERISKKAEVILERQAEKVGAGLELNAVIKPVPEKD